jgi:hypothetical protein
MITTTEDEMILYCDCPGCPMCSLWTPEGVATEHGQLLASLPRPPRCAVCIAGDLHDDRWQQTPPELRDFAKDSQPFPQHGGWACIGIDLCPRCTEVAANA